MLADLLACLLGWLVVCLLVSEGTLFRLSQPRETNSETEVIPDARHPWCSLATIFPGLAHCFEELRRAHGLGSRGSLSPARSPSQVPFPPFLVGRVPLLR